MPAWPSLLAATASLVAYASLVPPVAGDRDSGEFTLVLATGGLAHPTGYPLHTLAGVAFVHAAHALGASWAQAANLFSALGAAVATGALHAVGARLLARNLGGRAAAAAAFLPLLAFAPNPVWTLEATLAEVHAWHVAWVAVAALLGHRLLGGGATSARGAAAWGLVVGAGLAHHLTSVLFSVPLSAAIAAQAARSPRRPVLAAAFAAGALVPLSSLAWIAWRAAHPAAVQWPELAPGLRGVLEHATGAQYRGFLGRFAPSAGQRALLGAHVVPWLVPALGGAAAALFARGTGGERAWRRALGAGVVLSAAYALAYGVSDPVPYFLPALAIGLPLALAALAAVGPLRAMGRAPAFALAAALLVPAVAGVRTAQSRNAALVAFDGLLRRMWTALPPGPAFVVWDDDMASRLRAFQVLEGSRAADVEVVQPRHLTHPRPRAAFVRRHGFDPVAGIDARAAQGDAARSAALVEAIAGRLNAAGDRPVVLFRPDVPSMRLLAPAGGPDSTAAPGGAYPRRASETPPPTRPGSTR